MISSPIALRIDARPGRDLRSQIREAGSLGAKGVVLDAAGDLSPDRLGETGRRDLRHLLRSTELSLAALNLPTRRPFDTEEDLADRLARASRAFGLAYDLGTRLVLLNAGRVPVETETADGSGRRATLIRAVTELTRRGEHHGVILALEAGADPGATLAELIASIKLPALAASLAPGVQLRQGVDPVESVRQLGGLLAHAYASDPAATGATALQTPATATGGFSFSARALDWEAYLGALEEVDYRGFMTIWPGPAAETAEEFRSIKDRLDRF